MNTSIDYLISKKRRKDASNLFVAASRAFFSMDEELGVNFHTNHEIKSCKYINNQISEILTSSSAFKSDIVICSADYNHFDHQILEPKYSNYTEKYWDKRVMSPSCLIYYLGVDTIIDKLEHHNLFFDKDIDILSATSLPEMPLLKFLVFPSGKVTIISLFFCIFFRHSLPH